MRAFDCQANSHYCRDNICPLRDSDSLSEHLSPISGGAAQIATSCLPGNRVRASDQPDILYPVVRPHRVGNQNPASRQCKKAAACDAFREVPNEPCGAFARASVDQRYHFRATIAFGCSRPERSVAGPICASIPGFGKKASCDSPTSQGCRNRAKTKSGRHTNSPTSPSPSSSYHTTRRGNASARDAGACRKYPDS